MFPKGLPCWLIALRNVAKIVLAVEPQVELVTQMTFRIARARSLRDRALARGTEKSDRPRGRLAPTLDLMPAIRTMFHKSGLSKISCWYFLCMHRNRSGLRSDFEAQTL